MHAYCFVDKAQQPFPDLTYSQSMSALNSQILQSARSTSANDREYPLKDTQQTSFKTPCDLDETATSPSLPSHAMNSRQSTADDIRVPNVIVSNPNEHINRSESLILDGNIVSNVINRHDVTGRSIAGSNRADDTLNSPVSPRLTARMNSLPVLHRNKHSDTKPSRHTLPAGSFLKSSKSQSEISFTTQTSTDDDLTKYYDMNVMLRKGDVDNVPHVVHCMKVMHGVYLLIICEVCIKTDL